jgi:hypothetical protein
MTRSTIDERGGINGRLPTATLPATSILCQATEIFRLSLNQAISPRKSGHNDLIT